MRLENRTAIVTGGGRDIGRARAVRPAGEGARVAINDFSSGRSARAAVEVTEAAGGSAIALQADRDLNLTGTFRMVEPCLPHMTTGTIVDLSGQAGRHGGGPGSMSYAAPKGAPTDIAPLVGFLASEEAAFITGANVDIDVGMQFS